MPKRTCFMATVQRSGSNLLSSLMTQTGQLGRPGEYFNRNVVGEFAPPRSAGMAERCLFVRTNGTSENGVLAAKLFPGHITRLAKEIRISEWFGVPRWVWLRRRDRLDQAISWTIALQSRSYTSGGEARREPAYDAVLILDRLRAVIEGEARWQMYFSRTGVEPLELWYEDVAERPGDALAAVAALVDIALEGTAPDPDAIFRRQRTEVNGRWKARFRSELGDPDRFDAIGLRLKDGPVASLRRWLRRSLR